MVVGGPMTLEEEWKRYLAIIRYLNVLRGVGVDISGADYGAIERGDWRWDQKQP